MKQSGLGDNFYVDGINISNDLTALSGISCPRTSAEWTGIDKYAMERVLLKRDGLMAGTSQWDPAVSHLAFRSLPTANRVMSYFRGNGIGSPAASMMAKQINYDGTREEAGLFPFAFNAMADSYGLEWGDQLTPGPRTDTAPTNGSSFDNGAATAFGAQMWLHVFAFTGTSVTIKIQDSADNAAWADLAGATFGAISAIGAARVALANNVTVRRYLRVVTTGTFNPATFAVHFTRNLAAGLVF
jgi:hypothetical protein